MDIHYMKIDDYNVDYNIICVHHVDSKFKLYSWYQAPNLSSSNGKSLVKCIVQLSCKILFMIK